MLLRRRRSPVVLVLSAVFTAVALSATGFAGLVAYADSAFVAFAAAPLLLVPLPVAAALASSSDVGAFRMHIRLAWR